MVCAEDLGAAVAARAAEFAVDLRPVGGLARFLVERAALHSVRMDRAAAQEAALLAESTAEGATTDTADTAATAEAAQLARRYEAAAERAFFRCLREIRLARTQPETVQPVSPPRVPTRVVAMGSFGGGASLRADPDPAPGPAAPAARPAELPGVRTPMQPWRWASEVSIGRPPTA